MQPAVPARHVFFFFFFFFQKLRSVLGILLMRMDVFVQVCGTHYDTFYYIAAVAHKMQCHRC